jgi:hypothetical protein
VANLQSDQSALHTSVRNLEDILIQEVGAKVDKGLEEDAPSVSPKQEEEERKLDEERKNRKNARLGIYPIRKPVMRKAILEQM